MGINYGVIWAADFNNAIRFYVRRPAHRPRVNRRPPSHQNLKDMTDLPLLESILVLFGPLISIIQLDFKSIPLPAGQGSPAARCHTKKDDRYIVMGIDFGFIWAADSNNAIRF